SDGKTLTQTVHFSSPMGEADQKAVFEKQDGGAATSTATTSAPATITAGTTAPAKASSGSKPNFSGVWKLNVAKSDFGVLPGPESRTDTIEHTEPAIKIATKEEGPQGKRDYVISLTTDGKENTNTPGPGVELKSTSNWEGNALV